MKDKELITQRRLLIASEQILAEEINKDIKKIFIVRESNFYMLYVYSIIMIIMSLLYFASFSIGILSENENSDYIILICPFLIFSSILIIIALHNSDFFKKKQYEKLLRQARLLIKKSEKIEENSNFK